MTRCSPRVFLVIAALGGAIGIVAACSNQGEGEVCNILNGSDDCQTDIGLVCFDHNVLRNTLSDRCCPGDRTTATHPACKTEGASVLNDATAPANTGPDAAGGTTLQDAQVGTDASDAASTDAGDAGDATP